MSAEVIDLRRGERFVVLEPIAGTFATFDITLTNLGQTGLQIAHATPLRIGTRARITFRHGDLSVATSAHLVWSHLSQTPDPSGKLLYVSGLRIDAADTQYAAAISALFRAGLLRQDTESMEKKRARTRERDEARKAILRVKPL